MLQKKTNEAGSHFYPALFPEDLNPDDLGLYLSGAGQLNSQGHFAFAAIPDRVVFTYVHRGAGYVHTGDQEHIAQKGDVFVFWPGQHYTYGDQPKSPWRYTWLWLEGPSVTTALSQAGLTQDDVTLPHSDTPMMDQYFQQTLKRFMQTQYTPAATAAMAWDLIDMLASLQKHSQSYHTNIADAARLIMEQHYRRALSIEDLAETLEVERTTLFRQFKHRFGMSPKQYLNEFRLNKATEFLRTTSLSIKEIAVACGYTDQCYFSRVFAAQYGANPSQWRGACR